MEGDLNMPSARRRYPEIKKGLANALAALENLKNDAKYLDAAASTASGELKDNVAKKDIQALQDLAEAIRQAVTPGTERIRELEEEIKREEAEFEALEH